MAMRATKNFILTVDLVFFGLLLGLLGLRSEVELVVGMRLMVSDN